MPTYKAPLRDMRFLLKDVFKAEAALSELPYYTGHETHSADLADQILDEAARFASNVIQPLNMSGDAEGCSVKDGVVTTPAGFKEAFKQFAAAGWTGLDGDPEYGGQGVPHVIGNAVSEMMIGANTAWSMYPGLSHGAYTALKAYASDETKNIYLPKLLAGEWTGTMCLTEPHCGTDLGLLRTKAADNGDGTFSISGTKIFISAGEHDFADNIVHLVLARIEGAPAGTKGISLFLVPKFLVNADGSLGERNPVVCASLEHKMGIKANATAVLNFDGAKGILVGQPNKGMQAMFIMMNGARLGTAMQGLGLGEAAYQNALAYAKDRIQMRHEPRLTPAEPADPIIGYPDVRRMLMTVRAYNEGARALTFWLSLQLDVEHHHPDAGKREEAADIVALLTPVAKAFMTDNGFQGTVLAQQVFGGHGYIKEWGMEQFVRDARIGQIYEGTNGIQALDLIGRKVLGDGGKKLQKLSGLLATFVEVNEGNEDLAPMLDVLGKAAQQAGTLTMVIGQKAMQNPDEANAAAVDYLRYIGHVTYAYLFALMSKAALEQIALGNDKEGFYKAKLQTAQFYYAKLFPETKALAATIKAGNDTLAVDDAAMFGIERELAHA
ncbi:acyl-CoA dehydrogenase C-terminal domain-containing protein [Deinococcus altitudinis]|uniref:acyl-CoA dehydrogenase C-terminal domain-containing protein n=1 Tax=Deinococcus altitudinis TaxID=468914 RepID=UPI003892C36B